jgi:predicted HTH transcriptional regulator
MLQVIGELSESDKVLSACRQGESKTVEFKEFFSLDIAKGTRESYIEQSSLKTVAAFLNSEGGTLLIGVKDSGELSGIDREIDKFHKSTDKFLLHFKNLLKSKIGEAYYTFINYGIVRVSGRQVLMVNCQPSKAPCYLGGSEFYVRTNPATDKLEGQKLVEYVQNHFLR